MRIKLIIYNFFSKIFFNETVSSDKFVESEFKKKKKIKKHLPMFRKWIEGKELMITAGVCLLLLMALWFGGMIFSTWSPTKFFAGVEQYEDLELPGKNQFDKQQK